MYLLVASWSIKNHYRDNRVIILTCTRLRLNNEQGPFISTYTYETSSSSYGGGTVNSHLLEEVSKTDSTEYGHVSAARTLYARINENSGLWLFVCLVREKWKEQRGSRTTIHGSSLLSSYDAWISNNVESSDITSYKTEWACITRNPLHVLLTERSRYAVWQYCNKQRLNAPGYLQTERDCGYEDS
jgi:hypothetical protein